MYIDDRKQCTARRRGRDTVGLESDPTTNNPERSSKPLPTVGE